MYWMHGAEYINSEFIYNEGKMNSRHSHIELNHPPPSYFTDETRAAAKTDEREPKDKRTQREDI